MLSKGTAYAWGNSRARSKQIYGGAGESRTRDTQFRKLLLYPSELQPHTTILPQVVAASRSPGSHEGLAPSGTSHGAGRATAPVEAARNEQAANNTTSHGHYRLVCHGNCSFPEDRSAAHGAGGLVRASDGASGNRDAREISVSGADAFRQRVWSAVAVRCGRVLGRPAAPVQ